MNDIPVPLAQEKSPFLREVRATIRARGLAYKTEKTYLSWIKRFIYFVGMQHPKDLGDQQVADFLTDLAVNQEVAVNTQKTALNAVAFVYRDVIKRPLGKLDHSYSRQTTPIPTVFTHEEL